ncbi:MAG TPA: prepilin-type N-terminal cleavage/methylation domain-containing protein [Desulfosporosinus sp.]|nr:prepilin-type N-terminal cleavage/methylation domain-containing protein [Desulfosporosinus sp.]
MLKRLHSMKNTFDYEYTNGKQGFTLIEIMLVIAVVGLLAIVSVPKYQAITDHYKLESSAQIVVGQLRYAKQLSMDQRKNIYLAMDTNTVEVLDASNKEYGGIKAFDSGVNFSRMMSNGLKNESGKAKGLPHVVYDARGFVLNSPTGGGIVNIVLSTVRTNRSVMIVVELQTGDITVKW